MLYMVTFTINIPPMLAYIPYMDPMGIKDPAVKVGLEPSRIKVSTLRPSGPTVPPRAPQALQRPTPKPRESPRPQRPPTERR